MIIVLFQPITNVAFKGLNWMKYIIVCINTENYSVQDQQMFG